MYDHIHSTTSKSYTVTNTTEPTVRARYIGVYWIAREERLPEPLAMCVFHVRKTRRDNIHFGGYADRFGFFDREKGKWYEQRKVDYWMSIPILPTEEGVE